jgi:hypothetical protein
MNEPEGKKTTICRYLGMPETKTPAYLAYLSATKKTLFYNIDSSCCQHYKTFLLRR